MIPPINTTIISFVLFILCNYLLLKQNEGKQSKVSFVFHSTKDLQKMPLGKLSFFAYILSRKRSANQQNQLLQNHVFHVKTIQSAEN